MPNQSLTPFSYVVLTLVGQGGAGPHDLVRMARAGRIYWEAADSQWYAEPKRLEVLTAFLRRHYPARHQIVLYEASNFPVCQPVVRRIPLSRLPETTVLPLVTIYIPPAYDRPEDPKIMRWFDEA